MTFDRQRFLDDLRYLATLNIKWLHQGWSDPAIGFDCTGVVRYALEMQGVRLPQEIEDAFMSYHRPPNGNHMVALMRRHLQEVSVAEPSDLIVFYVHRNPCHVGIKMEGEQVAEAFDGIAVSKFYIRAVDPLQRIAACFRIPDFA